MKKFIDISILRFFSVLGTAYQVRITQADEKVFANIIKITKLNHFIVEKNSVSINFIDWKIWFPDKSINIVQVCSEWNVIPSRIEFR